MLVWTDDASNGHMRTSADLFLHTTKAGHKNIYIFVSPLNYVMSGDGRSAYCLYVGVS